MRFQLLVLVTLSGLVSFVSSSGFSQEKTDMERRGLFQRIFHKDQQSKHPLPGPGYNEPVHGVYMDRETDTISRLIKELPEAVESRDNDPVERYPHIPGYLSIKNASQEDIDDLIERIYDGYESRIDRMDPPDLRSARVLAMGTVPTGYPTVWKNRVQSAVWGDQRTVNSGIEDIYRRTLEHSNQVKVLRDLPLIRETGMQEADGEFDIETFMEGRAIRRNEPIGSSLTTGNNARRFREDEDYFEGGIRKKFFTGAEATLSNRFSTLNNNSTFLTPQNQGSSEMVLSVVQPLLDGGGYHYNQSKIKLARYDARMASAEFVRQLQSHLIEVNRAYWGLYYSRAYFILTRELVNETQSVLGQLEQRSDLDALQSEVLRARSSLALRKAMLSRAEMAIRNSEERLRALVNDPDQDIGSNAEMIPGTPPVMSRMIDDVQKVATDALRNRPEVQQGFDELRGAIVRRDMQKNEKLPTLNLVAEMMLGDIESREAVGRAFNDQFGDGTGYVLGFQFSQPWDNDTDRAQLLRSEIELRQQVNRLRSTIDLVLLEAVVSYRELMTAYRDMQGRYSALRATREEVRQLRDRLEVDTEAEGGRTTASQLQLILDSMDRNQTAEELFLDSVIAYNAAFASLDRARGTFLRTENVEIKRVRDSDEAHPNDDLERLQISKPYNVTGKGGKTYDLPSYDGYNSSSPSSSNPIPEVPTLSMNELAESEVAVVEPKRKRFFKPAKKEDALSNAVASKPSGDRGLFAGAFNSKKNHPSASVAPASRSYEEVDSTPAPANVAPVSYPDPEPAPATTSGEPTFARQNLIPDLPPAVAAQYSNPVALTSYSPPSRPAISGAPKVTPKPAVSVKKKKSLPAPSASVVPSATGSSTPSAAVAPSASVRPIN
ncbi:MAG: TolC family protein [Verrucomicrobiales bacterium]|nr:TolC family protein [Verrucomicrobiales bacterium]